MKYQKFWNQYRRLNYLWIYSQTTPQQRNERPCLDNEIEASSTKEASFQVVGESLLAKILKHNILLNDVLYAIFMTEL